MTIKMRRLNEIKEILKQHKEELFKRYRVKKIGIFGSYAVGKESEKSDIDILVELKEPVSLLALVGLENFLKEILDKKVEVVPKKDVRPELKERILKETIYI